MKSIADINAIREQMRSKVLIRDNTKEGETHVFVGMGTLGLEAGAVEVFNAFVDEISTREIKNVRISRSGALGTADKHPCVFVGCDPGASRLETATNKLRNVAQRAGIHYEGFGLHSGRDRQ